MAHSNRDKRRALREAQKQSRKASWIAFIGTSKNKKLSKAGALNRRPPEGKVKHVHAGLKSGRVVRVSRTVHQGAKCYNTGCGRCSEILA